MDWEAVGEVLGCVAASGAAAAVDSGLVLPGPSTCFVGEVLGCVAASGATTDVASGLVLPGPSTCFVGDVLGSVAASGAAAAVDSGLLVVPGPSTRFVGGALATAPRSGDVSALLVGDAVGPAAAEPPPREAVGSGLATALGVGLGLVALGPVLEVVVADWLGVDSRPPGPGLVVAGAFPAWVTELAVGDG